MRSDFKDITGNRFGSLLVIKYAFQKPGKHDKNHHWLVRCDCGNEKIMLGKTIKCSTSCGCIRHSNKVDMAGLRVGRWTITDEYKTTKNGTKWLCVCDCGTKKYVYRQGLKAFRTKSCGCLNIEIRTKHGLSKSYGPYNYFLRSDPVKKLRHQIGCSVRAAIKKNGSKKKWSLKDKLPYSILELKEHLESQWESWMSWSNYGGRANDVRRTWWIDHIKPQSLFRFKSMDDPEFIECWTLDNLRPLEKINNIKKGDKFPQ